MLLLQLIFVISFVISNKTFLLPRLIMYARVFVLLFHFRPLLLSVSYSGTVFSHFCTLDSYSLQKEVSQMKPVTSLLDPIPTSLFQSCFASCVLCFEHYK